MTPQRPPKDGIRAMPPGSLADSGDGKTLFGRIAPVGVWAEINSTREGHFMERHMPGVATKTFRESPPKIMFQHGKDPALGQRLIADPKELGEDEQGPFYRAEILDGLDPLLVDGLRRGLYGSSHTFEVVREDWNPKPKASRDNPKGLPERTIREIRVYELGPVTWPAYAGTETALRSMSDEFLLSGLAADPDHLRDIVAYIDPSAPSADAGAQPHLEPERRETPPNPPTIKESTTVEYVTRDEKAARCTELRGSLATLASEHPGVLPTDAQSRWDNETAELDALEADITAWDNRQAKLAAYVGDERKVSAPAVIVRKTPDDIYDLAAIQRGAGTPEQRDQSFRDNAMRAAEQMRVPGDRFDQDKSRERLMDLIDYRDSEDKEMARRVLATNSPQYRAAFNRYVLTGGSERGTALAVGVDGTGGYSVPVSFDPTIVAIGAHAVVNPIRSTARVETIVGTDTWQALTATAITAAYATEAAAADEQGPTFARPEFIAKRAHAFVTVSYEMAQDRPSLPGDLGALFGEAKDNLEGVQFVTGTGATVYPQGIGLKDAFTRVDSITNDTFAVGDVLALEAGVPIRHRLNAAWYLSRAAIRHIQSLETTGGQLFNGTNGYPAVGNPIGRPGGNTGMTLLGYPVYETPSMPWTPTTDDTTWGVLMDPRNYVVVDRVGMSIKVIPDMLNGATPSFPTGEIGIYAFWRNTARVLNADGGRQGAIQ